MAGVADRDRERVVARLRRQYAEGRLDERELSDRVELVLHARSRWEIAYALRGLPWLQDASARARHGLVVAAVGAVWLMFSAATFVAFVVWIAANGVSLAALLAFLAVWAIGSGLLYHRMAVSRRRLPPP